MCGTNLKKGLAFSEALFYAEWSGVSRKKKIMTMMGDDLFSTLEEERSFVDFIADHFTHAPAQASELFTCKNTVDRARIKLAFQKYQVSITTYRLLLKSGNPDHYKRSGALLNALYKSRIITSVAFDKGEYGSIDEVESHEAPGLSYCDAEHYIKFPRFYQEYYNELLSFDIAYQCCAAYEQNPTEYSFGYLENVCHYLTNEDLNVDSLSMLMRSLMLQTASTAVTKPQAQSRETEKV